jgi:Tfp pilus assembly protein PilF/regulator of replication initiation timing
MTNELTQHGIGIIGLQDVHNSNVNITQILGKSAEYKDLLNQLETQRDLFAYVPEDQTEKRLRISQTIAQLEAQIAQFKQDVTKLAQEFNRIEINTDRLRRAKAHFEQGEIAAARAVFDSEREQMQDENNRLVREKERYEQDVLPQLQHSSDEFYLRALLECTAYDNPNWLADTCEYFERSIKSFTNEENVFQYALFLQNHNRLNQAESWYQKYLDEFASGDIYKRANTLNNLGLLHTLKNEFAKAERRLVEALEIWRKLAEVNPPDYLPNVATTLFNFGSFHCMKNELAKAEAAYLEALEIWRKLAEVNLSAYMPDVARTLSNLGSLHCVKKEIAKAEKRLIEALEIWRKLAEVNSPDYLPSVATTHVHFGNLYLWKNELAKAEAAYLEALEIERKLAVNNPAAYLRNVAGTLDSLGSSHCAKNELAQAKEEYLEALEIRRQLAAVDPAVNLPDVAMTLINIACYYLQFSPNRERSLNYALEAVRILLPIVENAPYTQMYLQNAVGVLQAWGLSLEEINRLLVSP